MVTVVAVDNYPLLFAGFMLLDRVTNGHAYTMAIEEVCAHLNLNHSQRGLLEHAYRVLCGEEPFGKSPPVSHGAHWG